MMFTPLLYIAIGLYVLSAVFHAARKDGVSFPLLCAGFAVHTVYQISRGWISGVFISVPMAEGVFLMPWALSLIVIIARFVSERFEGWQSLVYLVVFFCFAPLVYPKGIETLGPTKLTTWAPIYFLFEVLGRACFYCGGWFAFLYLRTGRFGDRFHTPIVWGFVLFTVAQVTGAIWCWLGWAATFQWVYVHFQAAAVWCLFANYLHLRFLPKWDMRKKAGYAVAGSVIMLCITLSGYFRYFNEPRIGGY